MLQEHFKNRKAFVEWAPETLLETEMHFEFMESGIAFFTGEWEDVQVWCNISESDTLGMEFDKTEQISSMILSEHVVLSVGSKLVLHLD